MIRRNILYIRNAYQLVWKSSSKWTVIYGILTFLKSLLPLIIIYLFKLIIDQVTLALSSADNSEASKNLFLIIIFTAIVFFIQFMINSFNNLVKEIQNKHVNVYMYNLIHKKALELELEYFENPQYQDLFHRASQEATFRPVKIVNGLFQFAQSSISIILLAVLLLTFHWWVAIVLIVASLPEFMVRLRFAKKAFYLQQQQTQNERKQYYYHRILTSEPFAKELRIFGLGKLFTQRFKEIFDYIQNSRIKILRNKAFLETFAYSITVIAVFTTFGYISFQTIEGYFTIGTLVMYFMAFQKGMGYLKDMLNSISSLYEDNLFMRNLNDFINLKPITQDQTSIINFPMPLKSGIKLENVCFKYPNSNRNVLNQVNLFIPKGKTVAIVGENGAGKTTIAKLICGLYQPSNGQIFFDDIPSDKFTNEEFRSNISIVFQDYVLFNMTAKENIWFGNISTPIDEKNIRNAAKNSGIDAVLSKLPRGYDTTLGKLFENSEELSIGEWQKIALAKAFYRDSQIIILDEPTSSLDAKTEFELHHNFRNIIKDKTAVIISHRFSTVRMADLIVVLNNDTIVEQGSHEELINKDGLYARFYKMQSDME